jgi:hypothetical protein
VTPQELAVAVREIADGVLTAREIAAALNVSFRRIAHVLARHRDIPRPSSAEASLRASRNPKVVAARSAAMKARWSDPEFRARITTRLAEARREAAMHVEVPAWVPSDMQDEYVAIARQRGEHAAASFARQRKAERRAA